MKRISEDANLISSAIHHLRVFAIRSVLLGGFYISALGGAQASGWPEIFDPHTVHKIDIELVTPSDWDVIRFDLTNSIEVPANLWMNGDSANKILVSVRRKSSRALPSEADPQKIGLKVDINEYVSGQLWNGLAKLSLENGGDTGPVREGFAWALHELADPTYHAGLASWVRVYVNGKDLGIYVNAEQRDKQFLVNRNLYIKNASWLYEIDDIGSYALEVGDPNSPTFASLCYSPFQFASKRKPASCPTPSDINLYNQLTSLIDMNAMLRQAAVDAFTDNPDALFSHEKNYFFADFLQASGLGKRRYYPRDLDAVFRSTKASIYGQLGAKGKVTQTAHQSVILNNPSFRSAYNSTMTSLLNGPLSASNLHDFLDDVSSVVGPELATDPYHPNSVSDFAALKVWVTNRITNVRSQITKNGPPSPRP